VRKQVRGIWLPEAEEHLIAHIERGPDFAGAGTYQLWKLQAAFPYIKNFRHAVDIGAHVGLWSRILARCFARLTAFEPIEEHRACFKENVRPGQGCEIDLQPFALAGADEVLCFAVSPESTGGTHVKLEDDGGGPQVVARPLDSFALSQIDFLKIDCEGYEYFVLQGAEETVRRDRPCIVVEQKPGKGSMYGLDDKDAVKLLQSWGAELKFEIAGDFCFAWR
jgi:FkbM family methyltransferase